MEGVMEEGDSGFMGILGFKLLGFKLRIPWADGRICVSNCELIRVNIYLVSGAQTNASSHLLCTWDYASILQSYLLIKTLTKAEYAHKFVSNYNHQGRTPLSAKGEMVHFHNNKHVKKKLHMSKNLAVQNSSSLNHVM